MGRPARPRRGSPGAAAPRPRDRRQASAASARTGARRAQPSPRRSRRRGPASALSVSPPGAQPLIARSPAAQISRLCVHSSGSSSQIPASGSPRRASIAAAAISAARHPSGVESVVRGGSREQQQGLAERVELKLLVGAVPHEHLVGARVARQIEVPLRRHRLTCDGVHRPRSGAAVAQRCADEAHGMVEERPLAGLRGRLPRVALVPDPHVAVVEVAALTGTFGERHRGCGDHSAGRARQSGEHGARVPRVALPDGRGEVGHALTPRSLRLRPRLVRIGRPGVVVRQCDHEHEVVMVALGEVEPQAERLAPAAVGAPRRRRHRRSSRDGAGRSGRSSSPNRRGAADRASRPRSGRVGRGRSRRAPGRVER